MIDALKKAISIVGGQAQLAKGISKLTGRKVGQGNVWCWLNRDKDGVPPEYCLPIEHLTDGSIKAADLRPDVFLPIEQRTLDREAHMPP